MTADSQAFWSRQTSSRHRFSTEAFYAAKAEEHTALFAEDDCRAPAVDLGCGAGELLLHLAARLNVRAGLDYSGSMLEQAKIRLAGTGIELVQGDAFEYLPGRPLQVWLTCGALNQYLAPEALHRFLDLFLREAAPRSLYLFDCVDPVRYAALPYGTSYVRTAPPAAARRRGGIAAVRGVAGTVVRTLRAAVDAARLAARSRTGFRELAGPGMGYGYLPLFWLDACEARGLEVEIVSSRYYEYRYHALIRKPRSSAP